MFFVRTASIRDAEKVQQLLVETWHATYDAIHGADFVDEICQTWHSVENIKTNIDARDGEYVVADSGDEIGGMAFVKSPNKDGNAYLSQIYVRPDLQRQGIGRDLMNEVENCFPEAKNLRLGVDSKNLNAANFYEHIGYKNTGISFEDTISDRAIEALVFEKPLP
ncbi:MULTISPECIES: GNAT family N-acetyltransferase [unclassified Lentilitoribacter]|jgi:ribosomal protein S18 acetylase RimI-like enzyme|uniref:GNAT family N-acetyltransferase n=1 Tax=unclassified Lentilitoribacter TaxID=2647570 RepID=UPI0013A69861|nr:GNAT family N-acetyltransferase [Lentilitoribacter sp. Alg239-R112]